MHLNDEIKAKLPAFHNLAIEDNRVLLDGFELRGVQGFTLTQSVDDFPTLIVKLFVDDPANCSFKAHDELLPIPNPYGR